jgi:hypothetical protein
MAKAWREFLSAWEDYSIEAEECRELDDERVLVLDRRSGRGKTSSLEIERVDAGDALVFHIRDGKVIRFVGYFERDRALAHLGLEE